MMRMGILVAVVVMAYLASFGEATSQGDQLEFGLGHVENVFTFVAGHFCVAR